MDETATEPKPKLRWYQYRLVHLFVLMTVAAIACSWVACRLRKAERQKEAVTMIRELGGWVQYDYQFDANDDYMSETEPPGPTWFRNWVGVDFLADVVRVHLGGTQITDPGLEHLSWLTNLEGLDLPGTQITDAGLVHLRGLTKLRYLCLDDTQVSDAGLEHLKGLNNLEYLSLFETRVTDAGLVHLRGMTKLELLSLSGTQVSDAGLVHLKGLTNLELLWLDRTQVTDAAVAKLRQALPNCKIKH